MIILECWSSQKISNRKLQRHSYLKQSCQHQFIEHFVTNSVDGFYKK